MIPRYLTLVQVSNRTVDGIYVQYNCAVTTENAVRWVTKIAQCKVSDNETPARAEPRHSSQAAGAITYTVCDVDFNDLFTILSAEIQFLEDSTLGCW